MKLIWWSKFFVPIVLLCLGPETSWSRIPETSATKITLTYIVKISIIPLWPLNFNCSFLGLGTNFLILHVVVFWNLCLELLISRTLLKPKSFPIFLQAQQVGGDLNLELDLSGQLCVCMCVGSGVGGWVGAERHRDTKGQQESEWREKGNPFQHGLACIGGNI